MKSISQLLNQLSNQIILNGQLISPMSNESIPVINPDNEQIISSIINTNNQDLQNAISSALNLIMPSPPKRGNLLYKLADLMKRDFQQLALLESIDTGKTLNDTTKIDIPGSIQIYRYYAGLADKIEGNTYYIQNGLSYSILDPIGPVGVIYPWNFPSYILAQKIAPALAAGCPCIIKPPEEASLMALKMGLLLTEAGFPPGSVNVLTGYGNLVGNAIVNHPQINMITFTGSTKVGKSIIQNSAYPNIKRLQLELGGKSANIIFGDADIDFAVNQAMSAVFYNNGQVCIQGSRLFVHNSIYDQFLEKVINSISKIIVGDPLDQGTHQGPQISEKHLNRILNYIQIGQNEGATLLCGGKRIERKGYYMQPTLFTDLQDSMTIAREEIFGPVMCVFRFDDIEEVIKRANECQYGLAAGVVTRDMKIAQMMCRRLKAGNIYVNNYGNGGPQIPFGGLRDSGLGREMGLDGIMSYLEKKVIISC